MQEVTEARIRTALAAWGLERAGIEPLGSGLINVTRRVTGPDGRRYVLQRLHPVFPAAVNRDINAVTRRLAAAGLETPRLLPTRDGRLWLDAEDGCWRLMSLVAGETRDSLADAAQAAAAGSLLARFHRALDGMRHEFSNPRLGVHDTPRHLASLRAALDAHRDHPRYQRVAPLARQILDAAAALPALPVTPDRIVHGDPKINNMLFDAQTGEGIALVDLDTVGMMPLPLELGDALRSWCNPAGENKPAGRFSRKLFAGALRGYQQIASGWIRDAEIQAIVPATRRIIVELAARFCADALNESYFGWDPVRFSSRSEHNEIRAAGQLALATSLAKHQDELSALAGDIFRPG